MTIEQIVRLVLFLILSAWLVYFSRAALKQPRSHGFWRFFAWECILGLFLLNLPRWFEDPFSPRQLIAWFLLVVSAFLVLHAVYILRRYGRAGRQREDEALIGFEKTTQLVTKGVYGTIRHPMYSSLLFLAWGIFCKDPSLAAGLLAAAATGFLVATARADEAECQRFFGPAYREYKKRTKMFIPYLF
jgi:protein-S-isoprenylcysteine O-methyltransferase Ste14